MIQIEHLLSFCGVLAAGLVAASWQGLLLAGAVAALLELVPALGASRRWVIWSGVFLLAAGLNLRPMLLPGQKGILGQGAGVHLGPGWAVAIACAWAAVAVFRLTRLAREAARLRRLTRAAIPVRLPASCHALLRGMRPLEVCTSAEVTRPCVAGLLRPRVLLPAALPARLSEAELVQVLLHEVEHVRRGDGWTNLLQKMALALFPLDPALFWVDRRLCAEREMACDDHVLRQTGAPKAYAACLTRLAEGNMAARGLALALGTWEHRSELARRVYRILEWPVGVPASRWAAPLRRMQTGLIAALLLTAAAVLPRVPTLVSFGGVPVARSADLRAMPISSVAGGIPRPMLVKTSMPVPGRVEETGSIAPRRTHATPRNRHLHAGWRSTRLAASLQVLDIDVLRGTQLPPRMILTRSEQQQVALPAVYTVLRVRSGWLVIEL